MPTIPVELTRRVRTSLAAFGAEWIFFARVMSLFPRALARPVLVIEQIYSLGNRTLALVGFAGLFVGLVIALQLYGVLGRFGATSALGPIVAITLLRELGPVMAALLYAGRAGTALASEIGLMRATDQLSAMEMMAVDPVRRVVAPRFVGGVIAVPLLTLAFNVIGIFGAWLIAVRMMQMDPGVFWGQMHSAVDFMGDFINGIIKSFIFGLAVNLIAVHEGFNARSTADGVARATTRTVVVSSLTVLALDFVLTAFMFQGV
ncbi:MAG TPA: lipid asymmetry maintenance ABC transporter permease subunit MlaE [Gammaproteobacteria bacterium]|nr:lipid asymmetry maintenance ABC transporter permease subunit MlaE [Gammaproteobacteria bacterium]